MTPSRGRLRGLLLFLLTLPALAFIYFPILWLLSASFSTRAELLAVPIHWIPQHPTLKHYLDILLPGASASEVSKTIGLALINSLIVATLVTIVCLLLGSLAAYALVRVPFRHNQTLLVGILGTRMIPEISLVIPLFIAASSLGLIDTRTVLVITYLSFTLPFAIWLMAAFFQNIPMELEDAARIDGCSRLETLFKVVMPVSAPGLVSTALFIFLFAWDEFFFALIFTNSLAAKTAPVALAEFVGRYVTDINAMMAGGILVALPPVLLAVIFQRFIVSGLTAGAVKG
jgi:multiple sugar transport system permease protein